MAILGITGVMACGPDGVIGANGKLPWNYPEELEHFRQTVADKPLIMGYQTYISAPIYLRKRVGNIIFSQRHHQIVEAEGVGCFTNTNDFAKHYDLRDSTKTIPSLNSTSAPNMLLREIISNTSHFMIGGAQIAHLFLNHGWMDAFILTHVKQRYAGDVCLNLDLLQTLQPIPVYENNDFKIVLYITY